MDSQFSEIQFGFGLLREIVDGPFFGRLENSPFMPTQNKEKILGYDARLDKCRPLFLQFKRSEMLTRSTANEWSVFGNPYYRIEIYPDSVTHQHNLLVSLANQFGNSVFYAAPMFITENDFLNHYTNKTIQDHTKFINCRRLSTISGSTAHHICFMDKTKSYFFSEQITIEDNIKDIESILTKIERFSENEIRDEISLAIKKVFPNAIFNDGITYLERFGIMLVLFK
ncbi:MAG: hypothetical protein WC509_08170 [Candidatus Izemoplasmatales bacterium]